MPRGSPSPRRWWLPALQAAVILLAGYWTFAPALHGGWLWDDHTEILQNQDVRGSGGLAQVWFAPTSPDYFPLKTSLERLEWHLWREDTTGYHVTSIALHLLGALLFWLLLRRLGLRLAWLGGLLFAVYPLTVESVAWISEQKNLVSLPPLLLAMIAYLAFDQRGRTRDYVIALVAFTAAMLGKSSVVMFPFVILLYAWWKRGRISRRDLLASAAFFAVALALGLVTIWFQEHRAISTGHLVMGGFSSRLAGAGLALAFYAGKFLLPVGLLPAYPRWSIIPPSWPQFLPWLGLAALVGWSWRHRATWGRHVLLGLGFFVLNLLPVLGFVKMSFLYISYVSDHFVYLPLLGVIGLAVAGLDWLSGRLGTRRWFAFAGVAVLSVLLAAQSRRYAAVFRNARTLWTYTAKHNPQAWIAQHNLATALVDQGRIPEAIEHFKAALRIDPSSAGTHSNLGRILIRIGRLREGMAQEEEALRLDPDYATAYGDLGEALMRQGRTDEAIARFRQALKHDPRNPVTHTNLGDALLQTGRTEEAIQQYREALHLQPDNANGHFNLGNALARTGRVSEAITQFQAALRLNPRDAGAEFDLGYAFALTRHPEQAARHYEAALRINPDFAAAHNNLGSLYASEGRQQDAIAQFQQALKSQPDYAEAEVNLANAWVRLGDLAKAIGSYQHALKLQPDLPDLHFNLANAFFRAGRFSEAVVEYEAALRADPANTAAQRFLDLARQRAAAEKSGLTAPGPTTP